MIRTLQILSIFLISLQALASMPPLDPAGHGVERVDSLQPNTLVRTFDGYDARCESSADVGYPAYRMQISSISHEGSDTLAHFNVISLTCMQVSDQFKLVESSPVILWPNQYKAIEYRVLITNQDYQIIHEVELKLDSVVTNFTLRIPASEGYKLQAFMRSIVEYNNERTYRAFGSYNISLN